MPEARIEYLAHHLRSLGRLNVYILASEWRCTPNEVFHWLTALHQAGRLQRIQERPYFRVVGPDRNCRLM